MTESLSSGYQSGGKDLASSDGSSADEGSTPHLVTVLVLVAQSVGLLLVSWADARSRESASGAYGLFWAGLLAIFLPAAWRICDPRSSRADRLVLSLSLGAMLFLVKVVYGPTGFVFGDEFAHARAANNLLTNGKLFDSNPLLPITARYPGLAVITDTLARLSGLSTFVCSVILIGIARLVLVGCLFLLVEGLSSSSRVAGIAMLVYASNPQFLYWDAQYAYESLALPLAVALLYLIRKGREESHAALRRRVATYVLILAIILTHHVTSYYVGLVLLAWVLVAKLRGRNVPSGEQAPLEPAIVAVVATAFYLATVAPSTLSYLGPVLTRAARQGYQLLTTFHTSRQLFNNGGSGVSTPRWETVAAYVAVVVILALIPFGLYGVRRRKLSAIAAVLAWSSIAWIILLPLRLTQYGQETATRSAEFTFLGIGLALAIVLARKPLAEGRLRIAVLPALVVIFVGGVAISFNYSERMAPDLTASTVPTSPTPDDQAAAKWLLETFGPGHVVATDLVTRNSFGSSGRQNVVFGNSTVSHTYKIFYSPSMTPAVYAEIRNARVEFVVLQSRLVGRHPTGGPVFDVGEPVADSREAVAAEDFEKFAGVGGFVPVYASGEITIYQVSTALRAGTK